MDVRYPAREPETARARPWLMKRRSGDLRPSRSLGRLAGMLAMRHTAAPALVFIVLLSACGGGTVRSAPSALPSFAVAGSPPSTGADKSGPTAGAVPTSQEPRSGSPGPVETPAGAQSGPRIGPLDAPPPVTVRTDTTVLSLAPWTFCYERGCADGMPPASPPTVGNAARVEVAFELDGWTFEASFSPVGVACPRQQSVPLAKVGDRLVLEPAGPAGTYDVTLFGRGSGDLFVTFRWTTPRDGPMPVPEARLAILADHDGAVDSYGVELELSGLRETPRSATADITVTAGNGRSLTFSAERAERCFGEGVVYWDGPDEPGRQAADLGPAPFTYDVVVVLDGVRHRATAAWPSDEIDGNEPSVKLDFVPALPAIP